MTRADIIVLVFAVTITIVLYVALWSGHNVGTMVRIKYNQQLVNSVSLNDPQEIHVAGALGESIVEIKDHQVRFRSSPCNNKTCILHGWMHQAGEVMACLPNQVIVEVTGNDSKYDAISF